MSDATAALATASASLAPGAPAIGSHLDAAGAKKAGTDFEAFFLSQAFESMFSGVDTDPMFGGGSGESIYRSLMIQQYSKVAAQSGSIGIGAAVTREILQMQEKQR
ncbi:MAG TPA: rod-binding protein [Stellaceae bacterium]|nr:rod-binding protein [Stellaceae bacterium]